jgi:hypothetical protein
MMLHLSRKLSHNLC